MPNYSLDFFIEHFDTFRRENDHLTRFEKAHIAMKNSPRLAVAALRLAPRNPRTIQEGIAILISDARTILLGCVMLPAILCLLANVTAIFEEMLELAMIDRPDRSHDISRALTCSAIFS